MKFQQLTYGYGICIRENRKNLWWELRDFYEDDCLHAVSNQMIDPASIDPASIAVLPAWLVLA